MENLINYDPLDIGAKSSQLNINTLTIIRSFENGNDGQINHKNPIKMKKHRSKKLINDNKK